MKAKVIPMNSANKQKQNDNQHGLSPQLKELLEQRKLAKREPLTVENLRKTPGLENLSDEEATEAIDSIHKLVKIFFEMACQAEHTCIENQQVVCLNQENKAA